MKLKSIIIAGAIVLTAAAYIFWQHQQFQKAENGLDAMAADSTATPKPQVSLEAQAETALLGACSNHVGFSRVLDHSIKQNGDLTNWTGRATIDFVNKQGGVERTNLIFLFDRGVSGPLCLEDDGAEWQRDQDAAAK